MARNCAWCTDFRISLLNHKKSITILIDFRCVLPSRHPRWRNWLARPAVTIIASITGRLVVRAHHEEFFVFPKLDVVV